MAYFQRCYKVCVREGIIFISLTRLRVFSPQQLPNTLSLTTWSSPPTFLTDIHEQWQQNPCDIPLKIVVCQKGALQSYTISSHITRLVQFATNLTPLYKSLVSTRSGCHVLFFFGSFTFAAKKTRPSESKRSTASSNANFQLPGVGGGVDEVR